MRQWNSLSMAMVLAATAGAGSLAGCVGDIRVRDDPYYERRVYAPPPRPVYVEPAPGYVAPPPPGYVPAPAYVPEPAPDAGVVVQEAPPAPVYEVPPPPPEPGVVWIGGYWAHPGGRWVWVHGHYEHPPRRGAVWVAPSWEHAGVDFRFHAGGWR